jgi:hypothetical protein
MLTKDDLQPHPHIPDNQKFKETPPWKTTIIRYGPLSGIFAMLLAAGCIVSCLSVLAKSNRRAESWSVRTCIEYNPSLRHYDSQTKNGLYSNPELAPSTWIAYV